MKKCCLLLTLACLGLFSYSQKRPVRRGFADSLPVIRIEREPRFSLYLHSGYAVALGSTFKFYPDNKTSVSVMQLDNTPAIKQTEYEEDSKGLGDGLRLGIGLSYVLNDFLNIGIDVDYFKSRISKTKDSSFYSNQMISGNVDELSYNDEYTISYTTSLLSFSPNITFKAITRPNFFIYNKLGAIIIFRPSSIQRETNQGKYRLGWQGFYRDSAVSVMKVYDWGIRNPAFGFMGGIGAQRKVTQTLRVFAELQFTHIIFKVRNRLLTDFEMNGREMINTLSQSEKEIVFKESYSSEDVSTNPNQPTIAIYQKFPITFAGMQAGIIYRF